MRLVLNCLYRLQSAIAYAFEHTLSSVAERRRRLDNFSSGVHLRRCLPVRGSLRLLAASILIAVILRLLRVPLRPRVVAVTTAVRRARVDRHNDVPWMVALVMTVPPVLDARQVVVGINRGCRQNRLRVLCQCYCRLAFHQLHQT